MSISIYYKVLRKKILSNHEIDEIKAVASSFSVDSKIEEYIGSGKGLNWESFDWKINTSPAGFLKKAVIFEGATKLPDNSSDASWIGIQHWCACLTKIRGMLPDSEWSVHVEDHSIFWDKKNNCFDPSK